MTLALVLNDMRNELFNLISFLVTKEKKKKPNRKQNTKVLSVMHTEIFAVKNVSIFEICFKIPQVTEENGWSI